MPNKKRASRKELKYVKEVADELLIARKLQLPHDQSAIARIFNTDDGPILPGLPAYIPHVDTINTTRRVLYDLAREWQCVQRDDNKAQENVSEFFKFVITGLEQEHSKVKRLMLESALKQEYDLQLLHQKSAVSGIAKFLVDSFAVSIIAKSNSSVSEYMDWFLRWTDSLLKQWGNRQNNAIQTTKEGHSGIYTG